MDSTRTLFDNAVSNLQGARTIFTHASEDTGQLNIVGFHLQQAMELALKYLLEQEGIEYPKTHDIDQLIRVGHEANVDLFLTEYLEDHAEMFSQWEAKSRYVLGYAIESRKVERALQEVDQYLATIASNLRQ